MNAAIFHGPNQPLKLAEWQTPAIKPHEVLVRVAARGVCHTDLHSIDQGVPTFKKPPLILGREPSGIIAQVGNR